MRFLDEVAAAHPDIAVVETYGQSTEGRDLKVIRIGTPRPNKPAFYFEGGSIDAIIKSIKIYICRGDVE